MPGLNQRGPEGQGAMTGRQRGLCRRTEDQSFVFDRRGGDRRCGLGFGGGRGMGMRRGSGLGQGLGMGRRFDSGVNPPENSVANVFDELKDLRQEYQAAQNALNSLEAKIAALEAQK